MADQKPAEMETVYVYKYGDRCFSDFDSCKILLNPTSKIREITQKIVVA